MLHGESPTPAPGRRALTLLVASVIIAVLVAIASLLGLLTEWPYRLETDNWRLQARGQDIGNLVAVVVLVASAARMRAGSSRAAELWLGTLLYLLYAYVVYAFAVHLGRLFLVYVAVLGLVFYTILAAWPALQPGRAARGAARAFAGWTLIGIGCLFALLWLSELIPAAVTGRVPASLELAGLIVNPVHVIDLAVVLPGMIVIGVLTLRGHDSGSMLTVPALWFSVLMGSSIVAAMLLILASGDAGALFAMAMVLVVVALSLTAMLTFARSRSRSARERATS